MNGYISGGETWEKSSTSTGAALTVTLEIGEDSGNKPFEIYAGSSGATTATVKFGNSKSSLITKDTLTVGAGSFDEASYETSYRVCQVAIADANNNDIRIKAGR